MKKYFFTLSMMLITSISSYAEAPNLGNTSAYSPSTSRIVGGVKSLPNAWPSTVALLDVTKADQQNNYQAQFCGGSMVAPTWVLTAAHCVVDSTTGNVVDPATIYALVGASNLINDGQKITLKQIVVHPNYNQNTVDTDLALLELKFLPTLNIPLIPISVNDAPVNLLATTVGWGALADGVNDFPQDLYEVEVPIISRPICEGVYGAEFTSNMICAGYIQGGKDTCQSDSGGPLMGSQHGQIVQIGVTSWGVGCAKPDFYGVYTRLSNFEGWIKSHTGQASYPSGGLSSWSNFYSVASGGGNIGGLLYFLLFISSIVVIKRFKNRKEG